MIVRSLLDEVRETPVPARISPFLELRTTPYAGRSLFATSSIPAGSQLCSSPAPFTRTVAESYRQEVCEWCFSQNRVGRWRLYESAETRRGVRWFCSEQCRQGWRDEVGEVGISAVMAAEEVVTKARRRGRALSDKEIKGDGLYAGSTYDEEIDAAWAEAERAWEEKSGYDDDLLDMLREDDDVDVFRLLVDAMISLHIETHRSDTKMTSLRPSWDDLRSLVPSLAQYTDSASGKATLFSHIRMYHSLLSCLPAPLTQYVTPTNVLIVISRDITNSFGIWESDTGLIIRKDAALLGYAIFPHLSFFNHSCDPNVSKRRTGCAFEFTASRAIEAGEEVCISYLGGGEKESRKERQAKLEEGWNFKCQCTKCEKEK